MTTSLSNRLSYLPVPIILPPRQQGSHLLPPDLLVDLCSEEIDNTAHPSCSHVSTSNVPRDQVVDITDDNDGAESNCNKDITGINIDNHDLKEILSFNTEDISNDSSATVDPSEMYTALTKHDTDINVSIDIDTNIGAETDVNVNDRSLADNSDINRTTATTKNPSYSSSSSSSTSNCSSASSSITSYHGNDTGDSFQPEDSYRTADKHGSSSKFSLCSASDCSSSSGSSSSSGPSSGTSSSSGSMSGTSSSSSSGSMSGTTSSSSSSSGSMSGTTSSSSSSSSSMSGASSSFSSSSSSGFVIDPAVSSSNNCLDLCDIHSYCGSNNEDCRKDNDNYRRDGDINSSGDGSSSSSSSNGLNSTYDDSVIIISTNMKSSLNETNTKGTPMINQREVENEGRVILRLILQEIIEKSGLISLLDSHLRNESFIEIENHSDLYYLIFQVRINLFPI